MKRARATARAAAMQLIYEYLAGNEENDDSLLMIYDELREETAAQPQPVSADEPGLEERDYINRTFEGVVAHQAELEETIAACSRGWTIDRMHLVDRTILTLGAYEILYSKDVPGSVAVNEAVELSKTYSDEKAGPFINGVLGTILRKKQAEERAAAESAE